MEINKMAKDLALQMKGQKIDDTVVKEKFEGIWTIWISKFPSTRIIDVPIKHQIEATICEKFRSDATFIEKLRPVNSGN